MTFVDRAPELAFFNRLLQRTHPGPAQLVMLYGRRRVGKTALLRFWAEQSDLPFTYWSAEKEPAPLQRRKLYTALLHSLNHDLPVPVFESWSDLWQRIMQLLEGQRHILILDELPYAVEADPATLSALQHAWDFLLQPSQVVTVICGSHIRTMERLFSRQSPLFGRMTGQWYLQPLPFSALQAFVPSWSLEEQVATYAIVGGIPAYLSWLDPQQNLITNIKQVMLAPGSLVLAEAGFLLQDEVREPRPYQAILQAIGSGAQTFKAIADATLIRTAHLSLYLGQLQKLRLVERRLPAIIPPLAQHRSRMGHYHLSDPFLRFCFHFLASAAADGVLSYQPERILPDIQQGLRAFVGTTAWEELSRQWVRHIVIPGFLPQTIGSSWSRRVQVDVVAVNWQTHTIVLGKCTWSQEPVDRAFVRELIEVKTPLLFADMKETAADWTIHYAVFARSGATTAAMEMLTAHKGRLVTPAQLHSDLSTPAQAPPDMPDDWI